MSNRLPTVKVSIRKMGTRKGQPHCGAECTTCSAILIPFGASRDECVSAREAHKREGCRHSARYYNNLTPGIV